MDFERLVQRASDEQAAEREQAARAKQAAERQRAQQTDDAADIVRFARLIAQELQAQQTPYDHEFVYRHLVTVRKGFRTKYDQVEEVLAAGWTHGLHVSLMEVFGPRMAARAEGLLLSPHGKVLGISIDTPAPAYGVELSQRAQWIGGNTRRVIEEFDPTGKTSNSVFMLTNYGAIMDMLAHIAAGHNLDPAMFR